MSSAKNQNFLTQLTASFLITSPDRSELKQDQYSAFPIVSLQVPHFFLTMFSGTNCLPAELNVTRYLFSTKMQTSIECAGDGDVMLYLYSRHDHRVA